MTELWAGKSIATEIVTADFVGHWPDRDVRGPRQGGQHEASYKHRAASRGVWRD
jgi:hypothetical protein